eukprot:TRINITY_DN13134_c0_g1_i1.p5 TRINITY_DN13134_c0_g1~~TRINITY_DN13134_c0_g1_i1.p5  ORF type:complete len:102 (+),score=2.77 TRINITY_DN13134_c0_g1_i1:471-776(+)
MPPLPSVAMHLVVFVEVQHWMSQTRKKVATAADEAGAAPTGFVNAEILTDIFMKHTTSTRSRFDNRVCKTTARSATCPATLSTQHVHNAVRLERLLVTCII